MKNKEINKINLKHVLISSENFEKLKRLGYATESINDVITKILEQNKIMQSERLEADQIASI